MRVSRIARLTAVVGCVVGLAAGPASAAPTVSITSAVRNGAEAVVSGTAVFPAITEAQSVQGSNVEFSDKALAGAAGIDLVDAKILPLPDDAGLRFIWQLESLPAQVPPEGVRYTWAFKVGETQFQLQAKRTNMVNITTVEDPLGHARQLASGDFFQLRGACKDNYFGTPQPVSGCAHLAFLKGSFDTATKTVSMDVPYQTRDSIGRLVAEQFKAGVVVEEAQSAAMSVAAAFQAVVSNTATSDYINGWEPYYAGKRVDLAVGSPSAPPVSLAYTTPATLTGDTFSGTVQGLTATATTVFARACNGTECVYAKLTP